MGDSSSRDPLGRYCREHQREFANHGYYSVCPECYVRGYPAPLPVPPRRKPIDRTRRNGVRLSTITKAERRKRTKAKKAAKKARRR